jgi:PAS domain S-box-containing protein
VNIYSNIANTSEKRLHQSLLRHSEKLLDTCPAAIILWLLDGCILFANQAAAKLFGYSKQEILEKCSTDLFQTILPSLQTLFNKENNKFTTIDSIKGFKKNGKSFFCKIQAEQVEDEGIILLNTTITETSGSHKTEPSLSKTEQGWLLALERNRNQGVWDWNIETNEVHYSPSWKKMLGYEEQDDSPTIEIPPTVEEWQDRIHPDDREMVNDNVHKHIQGISPQYDSVFRLRTKDGSYKWILSRGIIISRSKDGKPLRMVGTHTDITERKEIEENYKFLFYNNPLPMLTFNSDTLRISDVNEAATEHYGYSRNEFLQMMVTDLHPEEHLEKTKELIQLNSSKEKCTYERLVHKKKNGDLIYVNLSIHIFNKGNNGYGIAIISDVTSKVKAEEDLRRSKEQYLLLFKEHPSPSWIIDHNTLRFIEVNEAVIKHYGYSREEFLNMSLYDVVTPEFHETLKTSTIKYCSESSFYLPYGKHIKKNGEQIIVEIRVSMLEYNGEKARLSVLNDITAKLEAEQNLKLSNERFEFVTKATSDIIWDWDLKKNLIYWSDSYEKVMGWKLPKDRLITSNTCQSRCHPQDRPKVLASIETLINDATKNIWEDEFRYKKADGSYAYISNRGILLRNEDGTAERIIGAMKDISDSKYLQHLQALELKVFEVSAVPGIHFHKVLKTLIKGFESMHPGMSASVSIYNLNHGLEIIAPKLSSELRHTIRLFIEAKKQKLVCRQNVKKNLIITTSEAEEWKQTNAHKWKTSWAFPVFHQSGNLLGFFIIFLKQFRNPADAELNAMARLGNLLRILTVNHLSVEQIHISNERYDNVIRATNDMIWDWNLETGTFYRNPEGLQRVYGVNDKNAVKKVYNWVKRVHPDDHKKLQKAINDVLKSPDQDSFDVEYRFRKDDGTYAYIYDRGIIIRNQEGKPLRLIGAAQNITDRKRLEKELLKKELDKQKIISQATIDTQEKERREIGKELHDNVNQVLNTTKLYLDLSVNRPEMKDELIQKSSRNIIYVINEIRQLSRSLMDPSIGDLGLVDALHDLIESINITGKLQLKLNADKKIESLFNEPQKLMIYRIIQETLSNIIKHSQAVSAQINIDNNTDAVSLIIKDDGIGFKPEAVKKGGGLKNIQNRVYLANGKLIIDTAPGRGCTIIINFPINPNKTTN